MFCSSRLLPWHSTNGTDQGMQQCPTACRANCSHLKPAGKHLQMPRQNHTPAPLCHHGRALAVAASHKFPRAIPAPEAGQQECHQHSGNGICTGCTYQSSCAPLLGHTCIDTCQGTWTPPATRPAPSSSGMHPRQLWGDDTWLSSFPAESHLPGAGFVPSLREESLLLTHPSFPLFSSNTSDHPVPGQSTSIRGVD